MTLTWTLDGPTAPDPASWCTMAGFPHFPTRGTGLIRDQVRIVSHRGRPRHHLTGKTGALVKWLCVNGPATSARCAAGTGEPARVTRSRLWELARQGRIRHDEATGTWAAAFDEIRLHAATIPAEGRPPGGHGEQGSCTTPRPSATSAARNSPPA